MDEASQPPDMAITDPLPALKMTSEELNLIFNHIVLPVQLPTESDAQPVQIENLLLSFALEAPQTYLATVDAEVRSQ